MLKVQRKSPQGMGAQRIGGVLTSTRWRNVMRFVYNEQVKFAWVGRFAIGGQCFTKEAQWPFTFEEVNRGDETWEVRPGIDMQPALAPQQLQQVAINDTKFQAKLVAHLVAPLHLQRGGADDQYLTSAVANNEFLADQPGLDGFAQANIVGNQQVDTRHL